MFKRRFKRRWLLILIIVFLVLAGAVYLLRWPLFGGPIKSVLAEALKEALHIEATVDELSGSLLTGVQCRSLSGSGINEEPNLRSLTLEGVRVEYNLIRLLSGELSALVIEAESGAATIDLDRPGIKSTAQDEPVSLPDSLPVLKLKSIDLTVSKKQHLWRIEDAALELNAPGPQGSQQGLLQAGTITHITAHKEEQWSGLHCPLAYSRQKLDVGPLNVDWNRDLLQLEAIFIEGDWLQTALSLETKLFNGRFSLSGTYGKETEKSFEADIKADSIDLAAASGWLQRLTGSDVTTGGDLQADVAVKGDLNDLSTLQADGKLHLRQGRFRDLAPIELVMEASFDQNILQIEKGHARTDESWVDLSDSSIPFEEGLPDLDEADGIVAFEFEDIGEDMEAAGLETDHLEILADADGQGQGTIRDGTLNLKSIRMETERGEILIQDLSLLRNRGEVRVNVGHLEGRYQGKDFMLLEPATLIFNPQGMETASLKMRSGNGTIAIDGRVSTDRTAKIQADIRDVDPGLLADLLPPELREQIDWKGFSLALDAEGTISAITGSLALTLKEFRYKTLSLTDLHLSALGRPDRIDVQRIDCIVAQGGRLSAYGGWDLNADDPWTVPEQYDAQVEIEELNLASLDGLIGYLDSLEGIADLQFRMEGNRSNPTAMLTLKGSMPQMHPALSPYLEGTIDAPGPWRVDLEASQDGKSIAVERLNIEDANSALVATASIPALFTPLGAGKIFAFDVDGPVEAKATLDQLGMKLHEGSDTILSADAALSGPFRYPEGSFQIRAEGLAYGKIASHDLYIDGALARGVLEVHDLNLQRSGRKVLAADLSVDLNGHDPGTLAALNADTPLTLRLTIDEEEVSPYTSAFDLPLTGTASVTLEGQGALGDPRFFMTLAVPNGKLVFVSNVNNGINGINGTGGPDEKLAYSYDLDLTLEGSPEGIEVQKISMQGLSTYFTGSGHLPLHLGLTPILERRLVDAQEPLSGSLSFSGFDLSEIAKLVPELRRISGFLSGHVTAGGTLADPELRSFIKLTQGSLRFRSGLSSMEQIEAEIDIDDKSYRLRQFEGRLGAGPVRLAGSVPHIGLIPASLDLRLTGENALLYRSTGVRIRGDLDVAITGPIEKPRATGEVAIRNSRFVRRVPLLPEKGPPPVDDKIHPFSLTGPVLQDAVLDLKIKTKGPGDLMLDNNLASGGVGIDLSLEGTGLKPYFVGAISFDDMLIRLPNFRFRVDSGSIIYSRQNPLRPTITCVAHGRRSSYDVDLMVEGPLSNPDYFLTSNPPLDHDDLVVLIASGALPQGSQAATVVGAYLAEEIYYELYGSESTEAGENLFDRLELSFGTEVGPDGTQNFILEYRLSGPWYAHVEEDIYKYWNTGIVYRIRFE